MFRYVYLADCTSKARTTSAHTETGKKVLTMAEYIEREAAIAWFMPYAHTGESIDADVVISDIKGMKAADVAPVRHGRWLCVDTDTEQFFLCNRCKKKEYWESNYCPNCGCKMDLEG